MIVDLCWTTGKDWNLGRNSCTKFDGIRFLTEFLVPASCQCFTHFQFKPFNQTPDFNFQNVRHNFQTNSCAIWQNYLGGCCTVFLNFKHIYFVFNETSDSCQNFTDYLPEFTFLEQFWRKGKTVVFSRTEGEVSPKPGEWWWYRYWCC